MYQSSPILLTLMLACAVVIGAILGGWGVLAFVQRDDARHGREAELAQDENRCNTITPSKMRTGGIKNGPAPPRPPLPGRCLTRDEARERSQAKNGELYSRLAEGDETYSTAMAITPDGTRHVVKSRNFSQSREAAETRTL